MKIFLILILFVLVVSGCSIKQEKNQSDVQKNNISKNQQNPKTVEKQIFQSSPIQQNLSDNFFPLEKGNYWEYQGSAKTLYNGEVTTEKLTRNIEVIDTIESGDLKIILLKGDFVYFTPDTLYNTVIEKNRNSYYFFEGRDLFDKLLKQAIDNINKQINLEEINLGRVEFSEDSIKDNVRLKDLETEDYIFLKYPLAKDEKFGCYGINAETREDNLYCRYVLDKKIIEMGGVNKDQYQLVDGTNANEIKLYFVPGIGVTKYQYKHNGPIDEATMDLINYNLVGTSTSKAKEMDKIIYQSNKELCANIKFIPLLSQEIKYNREIAKDEFVQYLRKALNDYLSGDYIKCDDKCDIFGLHNGKHYEDSAYGTDLLGFKDYLESKFIVLSTDIAPGGGSSLVIIFKNKPDKLFYAWVYGDGEGYFDLRTFWEYWHEIEGGTNEAETQRIFVNQICSNDAGV